MKNDIISFFAGVGGIDLGFEDAGKYHTVYANEFDKNAQHTFELNFNKRGTYLDRRDIKEVTTDDIRKQTQNADVLLAGFPCQPFSVAGFRKGFDDNRGDLFFETLRIIKSLQPRVVFLENVKNLVTHDHGNTFKVIREFMVHTGYYIKWKVLNSKEYGNVPQNRERIYVVGFKDKVAFEQFDFPNKIELTTSLSDIIDFDARVNTITKFGEKLEEKFFYRKDKQTFYPKLVAEMTSSNTVYQWRRQYVRENKSGVVPTLTANMGTGGHNVPLILTNNGEIRKLTPREAFNAQGYPTSYELPNDSSISALYKQAGNSVSVPVISRIARNIDKALKIGDSDLPLINRDNQYALIYTKMVGRMAGESYPVKWFDNISNAQLKMKEDSSQKNIAIYDDQDFYNAIKKGGNHEFYSIAG
ncbi:DNA-cytosine methyltransferase [Fructilactobacillus florum 8D]|uniref:Cytosine-specific methyltransferase n=1 Tax=Fructilactobacillus florum 8D TaxID=1221538 RepID=W9EHZ7_9LACO|nr:DNA cytosine methyltransferase [Fructilactobacillus florum]EKK21195.1 DNA-cytosine methyltransferase [Fructilactobacillus florum 2F]ETO40615.1 DNA-cytosine methyltransferase [Fructilactobacillus florum 8D]